MLNNEGTMTVVMNAYVFVSDSEALVKHNCWNNIIKGVGVSSPCSQFIFDTCFQWRSSVVVKNNSGTITKRVEIITEPKESCEKFVSMYVSAQLK